MSYSINDITLSVIIPLSCSCAAAGVKRSLGERKRVILEITELKKWKI